MATLRNRPKPMTWGTLLVAGIFWTAVAITAAVVLRPQVAEAPTHDAFNFDGSIPGDHAIPAVNPDPRVTWTPYSVGGLGLSNADTTITLPEGSTLWVPTVNRDSTWDAN